MLGLELQLMSAALNPKVFVPLRMQLLAHGGYSMNRTDPHSYLHDGALTVQRCAHRGRGLAHYASEMWPSEIWDVGSCPVRSGSFP